MDQIKIGRFIADRRKKQGLSQKQLAEQISVTDKTVSKWETGVRMPDASLLLDLSAVLQIDVNELLAGEEFLSESLQENSSEEYAKRSEDTIVNLVGELNDIDQEKKSRGIGTAGGLLLIGMAFLGVFVTSLPKGRIFDIIDLPTLCYLTGLKFCILSISGWFHDYLNAWKLCTARKDLPEKDIQASIQAVKYAGALSLALGCLVSMISLFSLLMYIKDTKFISSGLAQITLSYLYTAVAESIYIILYFRLKRLYRKG